jgi:hypothetical protein
LSLETLRQWRRAGYRPGGMALVVIGDVAPDTDAEYVVMVKPTDEPRLMDWRPLVGMTAAVFTMQPLPHLTIAVLDALNAMGIKVFGAADQFGVHPLLEGADEKHERLLQRAWELLCQ